MKKFILILGLLLTLLTLNAFGEVFEVPDGIEYIGFEAFSNTDIIKVFVPKSVMYIFDDAFPSSLIEILGFNGSAAQSYASEHSILFTSVDISDIALSAPSIVAPGEAFDVSVTCSSNFDVAYSYALINERGERLVSEQGSFVLDASGVYSVEVTAKNEYCEKTECFEACITVPASPRLVKTDFTIKIGDVFNPFDDTEDRMSELSYSGNGLSVSGNTVTALKNGVYTVNALVYEGDKCIKTEFTVRVCVPATEFKLNKDSISLSIGEAFALKYTIAPSTAKSNKVEWSSSDESIATINDNGVVTALSTGDCIIYAYTFDMLAEFNLHVNLPCDQILIDSIPENVPSVGSTYPLTVTYYPENADILDVVWSSSDTNIAQIDAETGLARFKNTGEVSFTAVLKSDANVFDTLTVTVKKGIEDLETDIPEAMSVGDEYAINVSFLPLDASGAFTYTSSDNSVLSVSSLGVLSAHKPGSAVIYVKASGVSTSKRVYVYESCESLSCPITNFYLTPGDSFSLTDVIGLSPSNSSLKTAVYACSNANVCSVDSNGCVCALNAGAADISISNGDAFIRLRVNVVTNGVIANNVQISTQYKILSEGEVVTFTANTDFGATSGYSHFAWFSEDTCVGTVTSSGLSAAFTAKGVGTTNVCCLTSGGKIYKIPVTVNPVNILGISAKTAAYTLDIGESVCVEYSVTPSDANKNRVLFASSNENVAFVDENGVISAVGAGVAAISLYCDNVSTAVKVNVNPINMTSAYLAETEIEGFAGESYKLNFTCEPENASPAAFNWTSDNKNVATVDANGVITFVSAGEAEIVGTATDESGITLRAWVNVSEKPIKRFILYTDDITLVSGECAQIEYSVYPKDASYSNAVYTSSNSSVAEVDLFGKVTAKKAGSAVISVSVGKGDYLMTQSFKVTVKASGGTTYRALIMGQFSYSDASGFLPFSINGTTAVRDAFKASVIDGNSYIISYMSPDSSISAFRKAISSLASKADEDDVTVIYILTHGLYDENGYYMRFTDNTRYYGSTLISDVSKISGHVVVVLCTCHSGRIMNVSELKQIKANGGVYNGKNGKGYLSVICSATDTVSSYYKVDRIDLSYDFFTKAFTQALGRDMIADKATTIECSSDACVTVSELASFVRNRTQTLISAYYQLNKTRNFSGSLSQYPTYFIADGDEALEIFERN